MKLDRRYEMLLIAFVVLGLFYPAIFAGENSVDDARMLQEITRYDIDFFGIFKPPGGFYYRPLLVLTFIFDRYMWDGTLSFMHLENILLHAGNALLVYLLVKKSLRYFSDEMVMAPLLAGLLFATHPIATESVNWISGRTDLLGAFFVLLATLVLLAAGERSSHLLVLLAAGFFTCAVLSKEIMVFYFPAACLVLWYVGGRGAVSWKMVAVFACPFVALVAAYVIWRVATVSASADGVADLLARWHYDAYNTLRVSFKAFGFYVKKMFIPLPLNFTIRQVSDWYTPFGLLMVLLSGWLLFRRCRFFWPIAIAFWMVMPAILVALTNVAWTPLAERYIYLSSAFVCVGLAPLLIKFGHLVGPKPGMLCLTILLASAATVTAQRNLIWQDNYLLYQDTLKKNPEFSAAHNEMGIALIESGQTDEAENLLRKAIDAGMGESNPLLYVNLARVYLNRNEFLRARQTLQLSFSDRSEANLEVIKMLAKVSELALIHNSLLDFDNQTLMLEDMIRTYRIIYEANNDTSQLYRAGQLLLALKRNDEAALAFAEVVERGPRDSYYYEAAAKFAVKLASQRH